MQFTENQTDNFQMNNSDYFPQDDYTPENIEVGPTNEQSISNSEWQQVNKPEDDIMSLKDWLITLVIMMIPIANIVMLFVWAFGNNAKEDQKNWAKAYLIIMLVIIVLTIVLSIVGTVAAIGAASSLI